MGRAAGLELVGCGGFVNVAAQRWYFLRQLKRLTSLRRWWRIWRGITARTDAAGYSVEGVEEVPAILEAVREFPLTDKKDFASCIWSYECYYWFRKR